MGQVDLTAKRMSTILEIAQVVNKTTTGKDTNRTIIFIMKL